MNYKTGDRVRCIEGQYGRLTDGKVYEALGVGVKNYMVKVKDDQGYDNWHPTSAFQPVTEDQPTLSDFDRIRLETAKPLAVWYRSEGYKDALTYALGDADELINLIMDNPFKRTV